MVRQHYARGSTVIFTPAMNAKGVIRIQEVRDKATAARAAVDEHDAVARAEQDIAEFPVERFMPPFLLEAGRADAGCPRGNTKAPGCLWGELRESGRSGRTGHLSILREKGWLECRGESVQGQAIEDLLIQAEPAREPPGSFVVRRQQSDISGERPGGRTLVRVEQQFRARISHLALRA
jgi:hypothetical protein